MAQSKDTAVTHVLRTVVQLVVALAVAIPTIAAALDLSATTTAKVTGIAAAITAVIAALQNAGEFQGFIPTLFGHGTEGDSNENTLEPGVPDAGQIGLLLLLAVVTLLLFGFGFTVHLLWWIAIVALVIWIILAISHGR